MNEKKSQIERFKEVARELEAAANGVLVDVICYLSRGLEPKAIARLCGNVSSLPMYMKSNDMPYRLCILRAPSIDILKDPDSH